MATERKEVQAHGFTWERDLLVNVYKATEEELKQIKYTDKIDLPAKFNRLDKCDISIKTSKSKDTICMGDVLRVFDMVDRGEPIHMVVVNYQQLSNKKKITNIIEINLTLSRELLFGSLTRMQIEEIDKLVKSVPSKRKPTKEEHTKMYCKRNELQKLSNAIYLNIKCDSKQSRLQCSFNKFQKFIKDNPKIIISMSNTNDFRGGIISHELISSPRKFNKK